MTEEWDLPSYGRGIQLYNERKFFDAHEVLEDVWRAAPPEDKKFLQGLIQLAVALHHHSRGNLVGARSLMTRAARNLSTYPHHYGGIDVATLLEGMRQCEAALSAGLPLPCIPLLHPPGC